jgi:predicted DsbA family dithiol-disulfide isomerase
MRVEIFADVVCPWCYIGERRFERALAAFPGRGRVEVVYRPFQLDAGAPARAFPLREYLTRRFGRSADAMTARASEAAAAEGIMIDWEAALAANTRNGHRLLGLAEREYGPEVQRTLMNELFAAHFSDGLDISDPARLTDLAANVGMERERVRAYLRSWEGTEELLADLGHAHELGIRAVPTFLFDGHSVVQGGQPTAVFLEVLEEVERRSATEARREEVLR